MTFNSRIISLAILILVLTGNGLANHGDTEKDNKKAVIMMEINLQADDKEIIRKAKFVQHNGGVNYLNKKNNYKNSDNRFTSCALYFKESDPKEGISTPEKGYMIYKPGTVIKKLSIPDSEDKILSKKTQTTFTETDAKALLTNMTEESFLDGSSRNIHQRNKNLPLLEGEGYDRKRRLVGQAFCSYKKIPTESGNSEWIANWRVCLPRNAGSRQYNVDLYQRENSKAYRDPQGSGIECKGSGRWQTGEEDLDIQDTLKQNNAELSDRGNTEEDSEARDTSEDRNFEDRETQEQLRSGDSVYPSEAEDQEENSRTEEERAETEQDDSNVEDNDQSQNKVQGELPIGIRNRLNSVVVRSRVENFVDSKTNQIKNILGQVNSQEDSSNLWSGSVQGYSNQYADLDEWRPQREIESSGDSVIVADSEDGNVFVLIGKESLDSRWNDYDGSERSPDNKPIYSKKPGIWKIHLFDSNRGSFKFLDPVRVKRWENDNEKKYIVFELKKTKKDGIKDDFEEKDKFFVYNEHKLKIDDQNNVYLAKSNEIEFNSLRTDWDPLEGKPLQPGRKNFEITSDRTALRDKCTINREKSASNVRVNYVIAPSKYSSDKNLDPLIKVKITNNNEKVIDPQVEVHSNDYDGGSDGVYDIGLFEELEKGNQVIYEGSIPGLHQGENSNYRIKVDNEGTKQISQLEFSIENSENSDCGSNFAVDESSRNEQTINTNFDPNTIDIPISEENEPEEEDGGNQRDSEEQQIEDFNGPTFEEFCRTNGRVNYLINRVVESSENSNKLQGIPEDLRYIAVCGKYIKYQCMKNPGKPLEIEVETGTNRVSSGMNTLYNEGHISDSERFGCETLVDSLCSTNEVEKNVRGSEGEYTCEE